jgi:hypothetical protein
MKSSAHQFPSHDLSDYAIIIGSAIAGLATAAARLRVQLLKGKTARKPTSEDRIQNGKAQRRKLRVQTQVPERGRAEQAASRFFGGPSPGSGEFYGLLKRSIVGGP